MDTPLVLTPHTPPNTHGDSHAPLLSTLLAQWVIQSDMLVAWLSLEPEDNEPTRFLTYFIAALQTLDPHLGASALALLGLPQPAEQETVLALLANDLTHWQGEAFALVLDDYHLVEAPPIHHALTFLLEHLPPQMHLVIATRADPPLPLARLRARGQLTELRAPTPVFFLCAAAGVHRSTGGSPVAPAGCRAVGLAHYSGR